ncbi:pyridoxal 5'-phosphate synthase glutaminase subunit PdxT [bacterium]|nr:pyridoxal 5'-phosphate synthase glutaminase subunit PdxT [candidate division CSSED10-310 bacterium]
MVTGVLAVQGGFARHGQMLERLGAQVRWIRTASDLTGCHGLIIPGGESTTMTLLLKKYGMMERLREFGLHHAVMGTCAGAIMLSRNAADDRVEPLGLMDISVDRNAYGTQVESFVTYIDTPFTPDRTPLKSIFIRAPRIRVDSTGVEVLATHDDYPVIVKQGRILALSFHPELTEDDRIHRYFLKNLVTVAE